MGKGVENSSPLEAKKNTNFGTEKNPEKKKEARILPNTFIVILRKRFSSLDAYIIISEESLSLK